MSSLVLYQFPVSHYCEKARWALDFKGLTYRKVSLVPLFHVPAMLALSRQTQVPVLVRDREIVVGSMAILESLEQDYPGCPPLFPEAPEAHAETIAIASEADRIIGPAVRRICYFHMINSRAALMPMLLREQGQLASWQLRTSWPFFRSLMIRALRLDEAHFLEAMDNFNQGLALLQSRLGRKRWFVQGRFTAADLTVAALLAPIARCIGSPYAPGNLSEEQKMPPAFLGLCSSYAEHPLMRWTHSVYAQRREPAAKID